MHVLVVKTSSLGDLIHTLPAITDAARLHRGLRLDWLVETAFAEIPAWHPAVDRVIRCNLRGWRRKPVDSVTQGNWSEFRAELRSQPYDCIIDAQGLLKSAWLASQARGPVHGPGWTSAREPLAAGFYDRRHGVPDYRALHAVERTRRLFAQALNYRLPDPVPAPDAGLGHVLFPRAELGIPYVIFLHGTTWPGKRWPIANWQALGRWLRDRQGLRIVLPWGSEAERLDAVAIAEACGGLVLPKLGLTALGGWLRQARAVVGVDTGLMHFAAALGVPGLSLYGPTLPSLTGAIGRNQVWLQDDPSVTTIDRKRNLALASHRAESALALLLDAPRE